VKSIWTDKGYQTEKGQKRFDDLFGSSEKLFQSPKPTGTLRTLLEMTLDDGDIGLDFFAGSASFGDAVFQECAERGIAIPMILVQYPEVIATDQPARKAGFHTIAELSRERLRRAGADVLKTRPDLTGKLDVGFRAFRIDSGNFQDARVAPDQATQGMLDGLISHIKDDRTDEDLLFGALLRWGVDITLPVRRDELLGRTVWIVDPPAEGDQGAALIACFARPQSGQGGIDTELADALAAMKPLRVLLRDDGFVSDSAKENVASRFKQRAPDTAVRVL
jgi:adenine-specific DNA-methyltransferase